MSDLRATLSDEPVEPPPGWELTWLDRPMGLARLSDGAESVIVLVEGSGQDWTVTLRGRRIPVTVRSHRERLMADAQVAGGTHAGPVDIRASLPGLVVAVGPAAGSEVAEGEALITIEAMKMQNEVRAPRAGRVMEVAVSAGQPVAAGTLLLRLE